MTPGQALLGLWRRHGPQLLPAWEDPHAELLTLMWGPRFDHAQARQWWSQGADGADANPHVRFAWWQAGLLFDQLPHGEQQRLRRLILRHRARSLSAHPWGTMPNGPHPAH